MQIEVVFINVLRLGTIQEGSKQEFHVLVSLHSGLSSYYCTYNLAMPSREATRVLYLREAL